MSFVADHTQAKALLIEALSVIKKLEQEHKLTTEQKDWPDMVRTALSKLHCRSLGAGLFIVAFYRPRMWTRVTNSQES
jgi:hypothetical protein